MSDYPDAFALRLAAAVRRLLPVKGAMDNLPDETLVNLQTSAGAVRQMVEAYYTAENAWPEREIVNIKTREGLTYSGAPHA